MKAFANMPIAALLITFIVAPTSGAVLHLQEDGDRTITKVVKLLQGMLDKSKEEGDTERELYAKFKCYCDQNEAEKRTEIEELTKQIGLLEAKIEDLQGLNGKLSTESAKLKSDMAANEAARTEAVSVRDKAHEEFVAEEADMVSAIAQMDQAIEVLSAIGADQNLQASADHEKFMAGYNQPTLLKLRSKVTSALAAASFFLTPDQKKAADAFLQAPFTGNYASQSGEIVGILKNMRDTFSSNLADARSTEAAQLKAHQEFMTAKEAEYSTLEASYNEKQSSLATNDGELASAKSQLETAEGTKSSDEEFLAQLLPMCDTKAKDYEKRNMLRANEQAAIAEAIAILNSDAAFESFGKVDATSTGATGPTLVQKKARKAGKAANFLQMGSTHRRVNVVRNHLQDVLQRAAAATHSSRLVKVIALVKAGNPFDVVLTEIEKVIALIDEEGKADKDNLDWCNSERTANNGELDAKNSQITSLNDAITTLKETINAPETGLLAQIKADEDALVTNSESQTSETKMRKDDNAAYQLDIANIVETELLLNKAIKVLNKYYAEIVREMEALQVKNGKKEEPAPPETWGESYTGQSSAGQSVITMLQFILSETEKEENTAHQEEETAQHDFEDSMQSLKDEETNLQESLAGLKQTLAEKEKELLEKQDDLKNTEAAKAAIEAYLEQIKPGCDFITSSFEYRESARATEKSALEQAITLIQRSPAYQSAVAEATVEGYGDCKSVCEGGQEQQAPCQACLAKVSVPGYCAGHPETPGCSGGAPAP